MTMNHELLEPGARNADWPRDLSFSFSQAISLKRIADALSGDGLKGLLDIVANHPMNNYGEGFSAAIQNAIVRGKNGVDSHG